MDSDWPLVTIGLCAKNCEKTVGKTVKSILALNYPKKKIEVILVYGPSKDRTLEEVNKCLKIQNVQWKYFYDEGKGLAYARQLVVSNASGKHIVWIDCDVEVPKNLVKEQVRTIESDFRIGASFCSTIHRGDTLVAKLEAYQVLIPSMKKMKIKHIVPYKTLAAGLEGTICRTESIRDIGGFDLSLDSGDDVDLFIRMQSHGSKFVRNKRTFAWHHRRTTWRSLWKESVWFGCGRYDIGKKHPYTVGGITARHIILNLARPLEITLKAFEVTKDPICVLLPIHYLFRRIGFLIGYMTRKYVVMRKIV